jgi:hypothetical protein
MEGGLLAGGCVAPPSAAARNSVAQAARSNYIVEDLLRLRERCSLGSDIDVVEGVVLHTCISIT